MLDIKNILIAAKGPRPISERNRDLKIFTIVILIN
tara:strand:- start:734 stop:838 length:105 start_codon:yes stop_codon:yes gene_type:complete